MGPIRGLRFIHAAIRSQANEIAARAESMRDASEAASLVDAASLLEKATNGHAQGEDVGYFPTLAERAAPGTVEPFGEEHEAERGRLARLRALAGDCADAAQLEALRALAVEVRDELDAHMRREEELLWPLTEAKFSPPEQGAIIGAVLQAVPKEDFPRLIPWMTDRQTPEEAVAYVQTLQRVQPPEAFAMSIRWIRDGVRQERWAELTAAVPELA